MATSDRGFRKIQIGDNKVSVYAGKRVGDALKEITSDMSLYHGVKLSAVLEAVYAQGKKDGARAAFAEVEKATATAMKAVPHKNPGRPRKS